MKRFFHNELDDVRSHLLLMGNKTIDMMRMSVRALVEGDLKYAAAVIEKDNDVDAMEAMIDAEAVRYMNLRAPVASDLRLLTVAIKVSHDLERVGDEACSIAKRTRRIYGEQVQIREFFDIPRMADLAESMLKEALQCLTDENADQASSICRRDAEVDNMNRSNFKQYVEMMKHSPDQSQSLVELVFISKCIERIADHATNIAEEAFFLLTGKSYKNKTTPAPAPHSPSPAPESAAS